ncbi:MAG: BamA/TamA family outer membrane protein, partial [Novosphingobium sp.]
LSLSYSNYSKSAEVSFTEPYLFDRNVSLGFNVYRRDYNSFNYLNNDRNTTYKQATTGFQLRAGIPLTEYISAVGSYTFNIDDVTLDPTQFFSDRVTPGVRECDPLLAGRYLCEAIGKRTSSILGLSLIYDSLDSRIRPSRGRSASVTAEFAGLGGSVKYGRLRGNVAQYWPIGKGWIFSLRGEGGLIKSFETRGAGIEPVRLTDRFYLGEPEMRGFDIRGVGPRVLRKFFIDTNGDGVADNFSPDRDNWGDDALGGKYYYLGHAELEIPLGSGARELGLRPSVFVDVGAVWGLRRPNVEPLNFPYSIVCNGAVTTGSASSQAAIPTLPATCTGSTDGVIASTPFQEFFVGNTKKPRVSVGIGVNWNSPFGPFRIDFAKVLVKSSADDTKSFTFNVGTQF